MYRVTCYMLHGMLLPSYFFFIHLAMYYYSCILFSMSRSSFTLIELILVIAIIASIAVILILLINPWFQIGKSHDAQRKNDLQKLQQALDEYYNDKGCYPKLSEICYDSATAQPHCSGSNKTATSFVCHICGKEPTSPSLAPYIETLPCDPEHPRKKYLYRMPVINYTRATCLTSSCPVGGNCDSCPSWYQVYSKFNTENDAQSKEKYCSYKSCGLDYGTNPNIEAYGYDYGISSTNVDLSRTSSYYCINKSNSCANCSSIATCESLKISGYCITIYGSEYQCCQMNPGTPGC